MYHHPAKLSLKKGYKMRFFVKILLLITGAVLIISSSLVSGEEISIFGNHKKPPKVYSDNGIPKGILIDIMKYVDSHLPESFEYKLYPWKRAFYSAKVGKGGIIGFSKNSERQKIFDYTDVMYYDEVVLVVLKGKEFDYQSIDDLKGKRVGIQLGASYGDAFEKAKNSIMTVDEDNNSEQRLLKLLADRIDVAVLGPGKASVNYFINHNKVLSANRGKIKTLPTPLKRDPNYLGFAKTMKKQPLIDRINKVLKRGYQSGDIPKIIDGYSKKLTY